MAGLRPYEEFDWFDQQDPNLGNPSMVGHYATQSYKKQMEADQAAQGQPQPGQQVPYNAPNVYDNGWLASAFGDFRMTPESPSIRESNHWNFYDQPVSQEGEEMVVSDHQAMTQDPGGSLAVSTAVRSRAGGGDGRTTPRERPKMNIEASKALEQEGKQVLFDQNKIPKWSESQAFYQGLLSFGLNLLSGNDLATSFNQGAAHFGQAFGQEKRALWAQDLVDQGYDAHEIQAWIQSGDPKALSDPMEKKMKQQAYKLGQAQLTKAEYETSPEYLEWQTDREYQKDLRAEESLDLQRQSTLSNIAANQAATNLAERKFKYQQQKDEAAAEKADKVAPRDALLAAQQLAVDLDVANQQIPTGGGIGASVLKGVTGEEIGSHLLTSEGMAKNFPDTAKANQIRIAQNQFTENGLRLATGALVRPAEQEMFRNYLFPQGNEFNNPQIVARKRAAQDVVNTIARNVGMGKTRAFDPSYMFKITKEVSEGNAQVVKRDGMVIGLRYKDGTVLQF